MLHGNSDSSITIEGGTASQHLIHNDTKSIDISSRVNNLSLSLLGSIILHSSQSHTCGSEAFIINVFIHTGNTKICQLDRTIASYQNILRFDIAMNNLTTMGGP